MAEEKPCRPIRLTMRQRYVSNCVCTFCLWIHLKTDRRFIDLLRPLVLTERHLMPRFSIGFVLKVVKYLEMRNGKLDTRSDFGSFLSSCGIEAICIF